MIHILSDLHIDINKDWKNAFRSEHVKVVLGGGKPLPVTLVVAGDVCPLRNTALYTSCLKYLKYLYSEVVVVMGNHEYYHAGLDATSRRFQLACQETQVHGLEKSSAMIGGVRYVGTTLWTYPTDDTQMYCAGRLNDQKYCPNLTLDKIRSLHMENTAWLATQPLEEAVVISHHVPCKELIHPMYHAPSYSKVSSYFVSDQGPLLERSRMWICGHSHKPMRAIVKGCACICHPLGYRDSEEAAQFPLHIQLPSARQLVKL